MLTTVAKPHRAQPRSGFTLVELLVTIGIIAALVGILIPVATRIRRSAQVAETQNMINRLQAAITAYQQEHAGYPGLFANREVLNVNGATGGNQTIKATSSENLVLSLAGGYNPNLPSNPSGNQFVIPTYDATTVSQGPMSCNWRKPQRYRAHMDVQANDLSTSRAESNLGSAAPEFIDRFSQPKAIIYLRANVGAQGIVGDNDTGFQYNGTHMDAYLPAGGYKGLFPNGHIATPQAYFGEPAANPTNAKQKDTYMLISAGPDGKYGTQDDITNFGL